MRLPSSHRGFLTVHNGARLSVDVSHPIEWSHEIYILSAAEIVAATAQAREILLEVLDDPEARDAVPDLVEFARFGSSGDICLFNSRIIDDQGEYSVTDGFHETFGDWRTSVIATSFDEWLGAIFAAVIVHKQLPFYWLPTSIEDVLRQ